MPLNEANSVRKMIERHSEGILQATSEGMKVAALEEAYTSLVRDLVKFNEDDGWMPLFGNTAAVVKGLSLDDLFCVVPHLEKQTKVLGDLLGRGLRLKNNHVFGRGFRFERADGQPLQPRFQAIISDPKNADAIFSPTAMKALNRIVFTAGNLVVKYDKKKRKFQRLAIDTDIKNWITEDDDPTELKYLLREWEVRDDLSTLDTKTKREWIPVSTYDATNPAYPKSIKVGNENVPVNKDAVIIFKAFNRDNGETFGVPDAFAAAAPAAVYADYMKSGAKLFHALAAISFVVKAKTQAAAKSAGAKLQNGRVAQAAITGPDTEITSLPRANSVSLYDGRPLVARVASALDVSTTGITSDPGLGGSYASENALSGPEQMSALSRQEDFTHFFAEVFRVIGAKEIVLNWNRIDPDPLHRGLQSLGIARTLGGISQAEFRARALELLDIEAIGTGLPEPDEFTGSKYASLKDSFLSGDNANDPASTDPIASQGNSGAVGSLDDDNSARNDDNASGTA